MKTLALLFIFTASTAALAQANERSATDELFVKSLGGIKLVYGIETPAAIAKPVQFSYTRPAEGASSSSIDAGMFGGYGIKWGLLQTEIMGGAALHRNTAASSEKDTVLAGIGARGETGENLHHALAFQSKNDRVKGTRGAVGSLELMPYVPTKLNSTVKIADGMYVVPQLGFGIQYERVSSVDEKTRIALAAAGLDDSGSVFRVTGTAGADFQLGRFTLAARIEGWRDARQTGLFEADPRTKTYKTVSVGFPLDAKKTFTLAIERVKGDNPIEGVVDADYTQLTLKVRELRLF